MKNNTIMVATCQNNKLQYVEVDAIEIFHAHGFKFALHLQVNDHAIFKYEISEYSTGFRVAAGFTREESINQFNIKCADHNILEWSNLISKAKDFIVIEAMKRDKR